jgi:hypothetical protein
MYEDEKSNVTLKTLLPKLSAFLSHFFQSFSFLPKISYSDQIHKKSSLCQATGFIILWKSMFSVYFSASAFSREIFKEPSTTLIYDSTNTGEISRENTKTISTHYFPVKIALCYFFILKMTQLSGIPIVMVQSQKCNNGPQSTFVFALCVYV